MVSAREWSVFRFDLYLFTYVPENGKERPGFYFFFFTISANTPPARCCCLAFFSFFFNSVNRCLSRLHTLNLESDLGVSKNESIGDFEQIEAMTLRLRMLLV